MSGVLVLLEHRGGQYNRMSWEALAAGQEIASSSSQPLTAAVLGNELEVLSNELAGRKLEKAYRVEHALLQNYTADGYVNAAEQLIKKLEPSFVVFPHTYQVRDFAPRLAARFGQVVLADLSGLRKDGDSFVFVRQLFQGKLNADYRHTASGPCFLSVQAGAFRAVLPQLAPYIAAAARSGLSLVWKIVLVAELLGRPNGVGFEIGVAFQLFDIPLLLAYSLSFAAVVLIIETVLVQPFEARLSRWRPRAA